MKLRKNFKQENSDRQKMLDEEDKSQGSGSLGDHGVHSNDIEVKLSGLDSDEDPQMELNEQKKNKSFWAG